jgi:hypothetical protein
MAVPRVCGRTPMCACGRPCRRDVLVVGVADRADGRAALRADHAHLARRQAQRGHVALLGHQLDAGAGRAGHLAAAAGLQLHVVHHGAERDVGSGSALPTVMSTSGPEATVMPTRSRFGARM